MIDVQRIPNAQFQDRSRKLVQNVNGKFNRKIERDQKALLTDLTDTARLRRHLHCEEQDLVGVTPMPTLSRALSREDLAQPNDTVAELVWQTYKDIPPKFAMQNGTWAHATLVNFEAGKLNPTEFGSIGDTPDRRVRGLLNRLSGLFFSGGYYEVERTCLLGRVYWRERWINEIKTIWNVNREEQAVIRHELNSGRVSRPISKVIHARMMLAGGSIGRGAIIRATTDWSRTQETRPTTPELWSALRKVAMALSCIEPETMDPNEVYRLARQAMGLEHRP